MASSGSSAPVVLGPVLFNDDENADADVNAAAPETPSEEHVGVVSALPSCAVPGLRCYIPGVLDAGGLDRGSRRPPAPLPAPRHSDVIVASLLKSGTTWLVALTLATMARRAYPPGAADHPLRRLNPHRCVPFLEGLFADRREGKLDALPSPRLINTHMPLAMIPAAVPAGGGGGGDGCKVVYVCREPKAMVVSLWHYLRRMYPELPFGDVFGMACDGTIPCGPFWDHILGYWRASAARPENVLFLRYEELLRDPAGNVRRLARFIGLPFTAEEEEGGVVVGDIVELCSLDSLRGVEANRTGYVDPHGKLPREALFRKGVADDWRNHMTPEMARRMDDIRCSKVSRHRAHFSVNSIMGCTLMIWFKKVCCE